MGNRDALLERQILAACMEDKSYLTDALSVLDGTEFEVSFHAYLFNILKSKWEKHRELPGIEFLCFKVERDYEDEAKKDAALRQLLEIAETEINSSKSLLEEVKEYKRHVVGVEAADQMLEALDTGDDDAMVGIFDEARRKISSMDATSELSDWYTKAQERVRSYTERANSDRVFAFETPLPTLNRLFPGGLPLHKTIGVLAPTNVGKSSFLAAMGWKALCDTPDAVVLHVSSEDTEEEVSIRYDSMYTGIDRKRFLRGLNNEEAKRYTTLFSQASERLSRLRIATVEKGHPVTAIEGLIRKVRDEFEEGPILVLYDSLFDSTMPGGKYKAGEKRHEVRAVHENIFNLAKSDAYGPIAMVYSWQTNKAGIGKALRVEHMAEGYDAARIPDAVVGLNEGVSDPSSPTKNIVANVVRTRFSGGKLAKMFVEADLRVCAFTEIGSDVPEDE